MKITVTTTEPPPRRVKRAPRSTKFAALRRQFRELEPQSWLKIEVEGPREKRAVQQAIRREAAALQIGVEVVVRGEFDVWARKKDKKYV